jgi:hypothetical protein
MIIYLSQFINSLTIFLLCNIFHFLFEKNLTDYQKFVL